MRPRTLQIRVIAGVSSILAPVLWAEPAPAQLYRQEVVIGLTPTCSEGFQACWPEALEALNRPKLREALGIASVTPNADLYNSTATVTLNDGAFPDPATWEQVLTKEVGRSVPFRGIEVTVTGTLSAERDRLIMTVPLAPGPITLAPLRHKLQYNFGKAAARQPEPDEQAACEMLAGRSRSGGGKPLEVQVTGPLRSTPDGLVLEVREFVDLSGAVLGNAPPGGASPSQQAPE